MAKGYLLFYNAASALGWSFLLYNVINSLLKGDTGKELWNRIDTILPIVQTTAFLEILHSLFGLVRAPLLTTIVQVGSRLLILWAYMIPTLGANGHWGLYLCIISWCFVEIPRYIFYAISLNYKDEPHKINSILFFLRYNLFMILYPTGITGELFIIYNAYNLSNYNTSLLLRMVIFHLLLYVPMGPYMIFNMYLNKKRAYKKRKNAANPRPLNGLIWPITDPKTNARSTTKTNKEIWSSSILSIDKKLSNKCNKERNWRFNYNEHVMNNVILSCKSKENALTIANNGLNKAYKLFEFKRGNTIMSFEKAIETDTFNKNIYNTHIIKGNKDIVKELNVSYGGGEYQGKPYYLGRNNKKIISGLELREQLEKWVKYGTIEQSAADSILEVNLNRNEWLDLSDRYFVLLGATSAMGPLYFLLEHGANIIAVDLDRDFIWKKLFAAVRNSGGTLIFPVKQDIENIESLSDDELSKVSGCNLLSDTPEISNWLTSILPDKQFIIGNYTYLDGALHVQLSLACDSIIKRLCNERNNTIIAFLCTPTDNHVISKDAYKASKESFKLNVPFIIKLLNNLFFNKFVGLPNYKCMKYVDESSLYIIDGIVIAQGPNYALAKRIQHWRAVIAYCNGHIVSSNIAPSTATLSVVHNKQFAAAYGGMHIFKPMEVMYQRTSLSVMGTLLIHDVCNKDSVSNPNSQLSKSLINPYQLFSYGSFNGGVWRCSYKIDSIGVASALSFYITTYKPQIVSGLIGLIAATKWLLTGHLSPF